MEMLDEILIRSVVSFRAVHKLNKLENNVYPAGDFLLGLFSLVFNSYVIKITFKCHVNFFDPFRNGIMLLRTVI